MNISGNIRTSIRVKKMTGIKVEILLFLVKTFLTSLFLLAKVGLQQVFGPTIFLKVNYKILVFFFKYAD